MECEVQRLIYFPQKRYIRVFSM